MPALCDINVLLALCYGGHAQHEPALRWLDTITEPAQVIVCRITQLGLLRLINNPVVMQTDVHDAQAAWQVYDALMADDRFTFEDEPRGLGDALRALTSARGFAPKVWADAHLAAFALATNVDLVTFDQGFKQFKNLRAVILKSG